MTRSSLALLFLAAWLQDAPATPTVEVRVGSANVSLGERFEVTVEATGPEGTTYEFPPNLSTGAVDLTRQSKPSARRNIAVYDAQALALGEEAVLPEMSISYRLPDGSTGVVTTARQPINVVTALDPNEPNPAPADLAPPVPVKVSRAFWIANTIAGVCLLAALFLLIRRLRLPKKPADVASTPPISPEEEALVALDRLAQGQSGLEPRAFYIAVVQILKQYLERRMGAPVLEMTSTETVAFVKTQPWTAPHAVGLRDLVTAADLAKFGGANDPPNAEKQIQLVREIVGRVDRLRRAELERLAEEEKRKSA